MFSYLLFFSSVLFEIEKDLWKIMDFGYELFNKTKQKDRSISFHKSDCSHSKNDQALLETQNGTFSNPHLHWVLRFPYCLISFWKWKVCHKRHGERNNLKEMCGEFTSRVTFSKGLQSKYTNGREYSTPHPPSLSCERNSQACTSPASSLFSTQSFAQRGSKRLWKGRIQSKEFTGGGEGVSLQQFPRSAQLGGGFSQAVSGEPRRTFILK